jgi:hypothetical protein
MNRLKNSPSLLLITYGLAATASAGTASDERRAAVDFAREVYPVLQRSCFECHGSERQRGGLRLDVRAAALQGGSGGRVVVPGKAEQSELYRRITLPKGHEEIMPARGEPLARVHLERIRDWINQGAAWPAGVRAGSHWAYVKPVRPARPRINSPAWPRNDIDSFILARLEKEGLRPSPEATREQWLRRVSLDLIGLPPTPAEVDAFLADRGPNAYEQVVERLLASPQYGERWARPWLDLARYADSHGFQRDDLRDLWPYRDWVIRSLNADVPFDRFTLEQIAGDLLPGATVDQRVATGFHRCAPTNVEAGTDQEENRVNQVFDRVNTTATVWLGTTLECAQCHDHKYDPFTQKEYYQLFAFFNNTEKETDFTSPKARAALKFTGPYLELPPSEGEQPPGEAQPKHERPPTGVGPRGKTAAAPGTEREQASPDVKTHQPPRTLVMQEMAQPRPSTVLVRGVFLDKGEPVRPGTPAVLHALPEGPGNRLALARWLVDRDNPLVARVTVNRWWAEFFGRGLVSTPEDFGVKGEPPTHPELLDWLAVEFMERGWSMKAVHRLIVLSATYRQSSKVTPELLAKDDQNKLYARGPRFRMDAEMIRDNALAVAGLLSLKQGGPAVRPYQPPAIWENKVGGDRVTYVKSEGEDGYRRGVYVVWKRASPYPSFMNFDATARTACVAQRSRSNTPLQALTLLNDPVYVEAAQALARRVLAERPAVHIEERIRHAFRLCVARAPTEGEVRVLKQLHEQLLGRYAGDATAAKELIGRSSIPPGTSPAEFAAWLGVAAALLNLDEMITKG